MSLTVSSWRCRASRAPLWKASVLLARFTKARSSASMSLPFQLAGTLSRTL